MRRGTRRIEKRPVYTLEQLRKYGYPKGPWKIAQKDRMEFKKTYGY